MAYLVSLFILFFSVQVSASDIPANMPITSKSDAETVCAATCEQHDCGWSGQWRAAAGGKAAQCDCGPTRIIKIPGGVIRSQVQAVEACNEICSLNEAPWTGEWEHVPGAFDLCSCRKVGDWCEPKKNLN